MNIQKAILTVTGKRTMVLEVEFQYAPDKRWSLKATYAFVDGEPYTKISK